MTGLPRNSSHASGACANHLREGGKLLASTGDSVSHGGSAVGCAATAAPFAALGTGASSNFAPKPAKPRISGSVTISTAVPKGTGPGTSSWTSAVVGLAVAVSASGYV